MAGSSLSYDRAKPPSDAYRVISLVFLGGAVFEYEADGFGEPFGFEDDVVTQFFVIAVVDDVAEVVHEAG